MEPNKNKLKLHLNACTQIHANLDRATAIIEHFFHTLVDQLFQQSILEKSTLASFTLKSDDSNNDVTVEVIANTVKSLLCNIVRHETPIPQIVNELIELGVNSNVTDALQSIWHSRWNDLKRYNTSKISSMASSTNKTSHLSNFDWSVRLSLASSRNASMQEPRAVISFETTSSDPFAAITRKQVVEMDTNKLSEFVDALDAIDAKLHVGHISHASTGSNIPEVHH